MLSFYGESMDRRAGSFLLLYITEYLEKLYGYLLRFDKSNFTVVALDRAGEV